MRMLPLLLLLLSVWPRLVLAGTIVIDFESFVDGDTITTQLPGLTFGNTGVLTAGVSLNEFELPPRSGTNVVFDSGGPITISFDVPVLSFAGYFTYFQSLSVAAFNSANAQVDVDTSQFSTNLALSGDTGSLPNELLQVTSASGIRSVVITANSAGGSFVMDDATFTDEAVIPEPNQILTLLPAVGLMGWVYTRRNRRLKAGR